MINPEAPTPDRELENRIDHAALLLHTAPTPDERRMAWETLKHLVGQRTPERVREMEVEQGIAR
jgi:hypothetical protein